jgi:hypothetical protein
MPLPGLRFYLSYFLFSFFAVLGFELQAFHLSHTSSPFSCSYLSDRISHFCPEQALDCLVSVSASHIGGGTHHLTGPGFLTSIWHCSWDDIKYVVFSTDGSRFQGDGSRVKLAFSGHLPRATWFCMYDLM